MKQSMAPSLVFVAVCVLIIVLSWIYFPDWRETQGGLLTLIGIAAVGVLGFLKLYFDYLKSFRDATKPDEQKPTPPTPPRNQLGNVQQVGSGINVAGNEVNVTVEAPKPTHETHDTLGLRSPDKTITYVPRGDIEEKVIACLRGGGVGAIVGVNAPGGLGKTELAKRVSKILEADFKDNYLWVDVGESNIEQVLDSLILKLNVPLPPNATEDIKRNEMQSKLKQSGKLMIVFDDVRRASQNLIQELQIPQNCAVLITSRVQDLPSVRDIFPLHRMNPAQSRQLFEGVLGETVVAKELKEIDELAEKCKYNPLLMDNAARRIRQETDAPHPVRNYLRKAERFGVVQVGGESVLAVFDISYNDLSEADQRRFRWLAAFHSTGFSAAGAAFLWEIDDGQAHGVIDRFMNLSLVKRTPDEEPRYRLHDLWDEYAGGLLTKSGEEEDARKMLADWLVRLFDEHYSDNPGNAPEVFFELENLKISAQWANERGHGNLLALLVTKPRNWLYNVFRINDEWLEWLSSSLKYEIDSPQVKANVLQAIGDVQQFRKENDAALESYNEALKLFKTVGAKLGEANIYYSRGRMLVVTGKPKEGLEELQSAMNVYEEIGAISSQANIYMFLGQVMASSGQKDEAIKMVSQAVSLGEKIDPNHPVTLYMKEFLKKLREG